MHTTRRKQSSLLIVVLLLGSGRIAGAQDLEARAYSAAPIGMNFFTVGFGRSSGGVVVDPSLPVADVQATLNLAAVGVGRTFSFFGRTALFVASFPYARGTATGTVGEEARSISRSGLTDPRLRLSINLAGGKALTASEFPKAKRPMIVGVSIAVSPPLGQYDRSKLVNLGANRWSFKPEVGVSHLKNKWTLDAYGGFWIFSENHEYYTGSSSRSQAPIIAIQGHTSYTLKPRLWVAFNATWYFGGTTTVDGVLKNDRQSNSRVGATASLPLTRNQSVKVVYGRGATTRIGANFTTINVGWQFSWVD